MTKRKIPLRKCLGCNEQKEKRELIRIVKSKDGDISIDFTGKMNGRGAYICHSEECLAKVRKNKSLSRAFKENVSAEIYDKLSEELINGR